MMAMGPHDLDDNERALIEHMRASRGQERPLKTLTEQEFRRFLRVELALGAPTIERRIQKMRRITGSWIDEGAVSRNEIRPQVYPGERVIITGTLNDLKASWKRHVEDLIERGASGAVVRHHREALSDYAQAIGAGWEPDAGIYEKRSTKARTKRSENIPLPPDFMDRVKEICNDVEYHKDVAYNEQLRHLARFSFHTAPRIPSESVRLRRDHVHEENGSVVYLTSKTTGVEAEPIFVEREVFDLRPSTLTWEQRRSYTSWNTKWRPKLVNRALHRHLIQEDHELVWMGLDGLPANPDRLRQDLANGMQTAWPDSYPYITREVGIIMRALEIVRTEGHLDVELLAQWSDHSSWDNLRKYTRKGKQLLRKYRPGPELNNLLYEWYQI